MKNVLWNSEVFFIKDFTVIKCWFYILLLFNKCLISWFLPKYTYLNVFAVGLHFSWLWPYGHYCALREGQLHSFSIFGFSYICSPGFYGEMSFYCWTMWIHVITSWHLKILPVFFPSVTRINYGFIPGCFEHVNVCSVHCRFRLLLIWNGKIQRLGVVFCKNVVISCRTAYSQWR